jgi:ABC-type amino acid transport substrate-binding protein
MMTTWMTQWGRLITVFVLTSLFAACGGNTNSPAPETTPTAAEAAPTATPAPPEPTATPIVQPTPVTPQVVAITVGVNAQFEPFVYLDANGQLVGFDIDLINALAQAGQFEVGFVDMSFEELLSAVASGEIDAAISAITITEERQQQIDFTDPYFESGQALVSYFNAGQGLAVRTDNMTITSTAALTEAVTVGVKADTTGATFVENETEAQVVPFPEAEPALAALANGDVDAVVVDVPVIVSYMRANPTAGIKLAGRPITDEQYGIAVSKDKPEVLTVLNQALAQLREDGTYDTIFQRWFGAP